jgi:hypothetical protein
MLNDYVKASAAAQKVIASSTADKDLVNEAHLINGKSALALDNLKRCKG